MKLQYLVGVENFFPLLSWSLTSATSKATGSMSSSELSRIGPRPGTHVFLSSPISSFTLFSWAVRVLERARVFTDVSRASLELCCTTSASLRCLVDTRDKLLKNHL